MFIIKKPIKKILFSLSSVSGLILALIGGLFLKNSEYNLSELENKAIKILGNKDLISIAKADVPGDGCAGGCIGGCASTDFGGSNGGDGCGSASASCGCAGCSDSSASSSSGGGGGGGGGGGC
jgi:hypothetical protein